MGKAFNVTMKDGKKLQKKLQKLENGGETAIKRTVSDFASRAPAWVSKGIRQHYGVDTAGVKAAGPRVVRGATHVHVQGLQVDGVTLEYKGKTLTPIHFGMKPATQNPRGQSNKRGLIPGQKINFSGEAGQVATVRPPNPYTVKATILKGSRTTFSENTYLQKAGKGSGPIIPFQRQGDGRGPVHAVHTLSVPQMISGKAKETIDELIEENMQKRLENHVKQIMK